MPHKDPIARRAWKKQWRAKRRQAFFKDKTCANCGSVINLELDHDVPEDKIAHNVWDWPKDRREAELAKCTVRCRPCHQKRHFQPPIHGTRKRYQKGCRCLACCSKYKEMTKLDNYRRREAKREWQSRKRLMIREIKSRPVISPEKGEQ